MKNNKSPYSDEAITAETLKQGGDFLHSVILEITNAVLNQKETPKKLREDMIIPILKQATKHMKEE